MRLPDIERLVRPRRPSAVHRAEPVADVNAAADALSQAQAAASGLQDWQAGAGTLREELTEGVTLLASLSAGSGEDGEGEADADEEPSETAVAFAALNDGLAQFDLARRDVGPAITAINDALAQLAEALGLSQVVTHDRAGHGLVINVAAILADTGHLDSPALRRLWRAYQQVNP